MVRMALEAAESLRTEGLNLAVVNARFVKPLDLKLLEKLAESSSLILTAEEGAIRGGFGQAVAEFLLTRQFAGRFRTLGVPDNFVTHGRRSELLREINLDSQGIAQTVMDEIEKLVADETELIPNSNRLARRLFLRRESEGPARKTGLGESETGTGSK